jgi:hypothetical protein
MLAGLQILCDEISARKASHKVLDQAPLVLLLALCTLQKPQLLGVLGGASAQ